MTDWERFEQMQPEEEQTDSAPGTFTHEPGESPSQPDVSPNAKLEKMSATGGEDAFPVSAPAESTDAQQEKTEQGIPATSRNPPMVSFLALRLEWWPASSSAFY